MHDTLQRLRDSLQQARCGHCPPMQLAHHWRAQTGLLAALPPRYGQVLEQVLLQLESGSLFTEESCSFSQKDLLDHLEVWLDKAQAQLPQQRA